MWAVIRELLRYIFLELVREYVWEIICHLISGWLSLILQ
jgi:hypothetical protein